jgi:hypothetical protein
MRRRACRARSTGAISGTRYGEHERIAADRLVIDVAQVRFERDERAVEVTGVQAGRQDRRLLLGPLDAQAVLAGTQDRGDLRHEIRRDRRDDAEAQHAGERVG